MSTPDPRRGRLSSGQDHGLPLELLQAVKDVVKHIEQCRLLVFVTFHQVRFDSLTMILNRLVDSMLQVRIDLHFAPGRGDKLLKRRAEIRLQFALELMFGVG